MNRRGWPVTWMLINGVQAAGDTWSALYRWGVPPQPEPAYLGQRWWLLAAENPLPLNAEVLEALVPAQRALVLTQDFAEEWSVLLQERGSSTVVRLDPREPIDAAVEEFSRGRPPRRTQPRRRRRPVSPVPLQDPGAEWLKRVGWPVHGGIDPMRFMKDADGVNAAGIATVPLWIGEQRVCAEVTRWAIDQVTDAEGGFGLWDRDDPDVLVKRWPRGEATRSGQGEGLAAALSEFQRRVVDPILLTTRLEGQRFWAPAPRLNNGRNRCGAVIAHWHPRGTLSVIQPWPVPQTQMITPVGWAMLGPNKVRIFHPSSIAGDEWLEVALDGIETALRVARAQSSPFELGEWIAVPDDVPTSLLETCNWVRAQVDGYNSGTE